MERVDFVVKGNPRGKERPRFTKCGMCYTPKTTIEYEKLIKAAYIESGGELIENPVHICITAHFSIPKAVKKAVYEKMASGEIKPAKKPDIDNIAKIVCDGLNGTAYRDDSQVCIIHARKRYTISEPRIEVTVMEMI